MKIVVVSEDTRTISAHFGYAQYYLIYSVEDGKIISQETRDKPGHIHFDRHDNHNGCAKSNGIAHSKTRHSEMMGVIMDCDVLLTREMGKSVYDGLKLRSIQPIITDICEAQAAVEAYIKGNLINYLEQLH